MADGYKQTRSTVQYHTPYILPSSECDGVNFYVPVDY